MQNEAQDLTSENLEQKEDVVQDDSVSEVTAQVTEEVDTPSSQQLKDKN